MTVKAQILSVSEEMTAAERKISAVVLADYPFGGLASIQELAERAKVSAPSITRFVAKLGCAGYQEFQRRLIDELKEGARSPIDLRATQDISARRGFLPAYFERVRSRLEQAAADVPEETFEAVCALIADPKRAVYVMGGRVSDSLARFLAINLRLVRKGVHHIPADPEMWPDYIQTMTSRDVVVLFDFRRYQPSLLRFAETASRTARPQIVVVTDQWLSPVAQLAQRIFALPIAVGTAWDTLVGPLALIEALVVKISEDEWENTRARFEAWDGLRDRLRIDPSGDASLPASRRD
ncbi:transcriptional regulator, RpiR family [Pseudoxanthobacter soli DSM 19599]|uniref:Transcriptional regulator, RpiR family n=2 Tax=Pseudoxanthobacter TaxID=433838 RepID=A0A1M7ZM30_9HYPH|nr:transcriptional regulator, RpiR family [Pseudoxanthobacter soli DSM 19599]